MPADFKNADHGTRQLRVATRNGVIFATYSDKTPPLEEYMTKEIVEEFDVPFSGKKLKILGYCRNELPCNWKMYHENLKDPYHATLLHSFLVVFGLLVPGIKSIVFADKAHAPPRLHGVGQAGRDVRHCRRRRQGADAILQRQPAAARRTVPRLRQEFESPWSANMMTIWPNLIVQRQMNTMGVRQIIPNGPNSMVMRGRCSGTRTTRRR